MVVINFMRDPQADPSSEIPQFTMIELQGELNVQDGMCLSAQEVGHLLFNKQNQPVLIIGHHIIVGKVEEMKRPMVIFKKNSELANFEKAGLPLTQPLSESQQTSNRAPAPCYLAEGVIKRKLVFRMRPRPFVTSAATVPCAFGSPK